MSVFEIDTLRQTLGGEWRQPAPDHALPHVVGVGIDSREDLTNKMFFAIQGDTHDGHDYITAAAAAGAAIIVIERDPPASNLPQATGIIRVDSTRKALAKLALAHRRTLSTTKVIGVTGSSGKTTTKRLIDSILSQAMSGSCAVRSFNNDIGVPLTLLAAKPSDRYVVVEIGTNAPGEIGALAAIAEPDIAVITSVGRAHLEGLGTVEDVAREKASILSHLRDGGTSIINADCHLSREYLKLAPNLVLFGECDEADLRLTDRGWGKTSKHHNAETSDLAKPKDEAVPGATYPASHGGCRNWFEINNRQRFEIAMPGRHNALNALAAIAVARRLGVSDEHIEAGLLAAEPEPMRLAIERIGEIDLINDAYNANPDSTIAALRTFGELAADAKRRVIVLGDMLELGKGGPELHREVGRELRSLHAQHPIGRLILFGDLVQHIATEISDVLSQDQLLHRPKLEDEMIDEVISRFSPGDAVLLKGSRRIGLERIAERLNTSQNTTSAPCIA